MRTTKWIAAAVGCALVVWSLFLNPLATLAVIGAAVLLGILYLYFIYFARPNTVVTLDDMRDHKWHTVDLGKTTISGNGSDYAMYVRRGNSENLIIHFSGGGACWDDHSAGRPITPLRMLRGYTRDLRAFYFNSLTKLFPTALTGMANRTDAMNAFSDWNIVFIPYTTGDMHVGDVVNTYAGERRNFDVHHNGRNNTKAALAWVYANFRDVGKVMVSGESSGAWASAFYAPQVADHYADNRVYCLSDGVGIRSPRWPELFDRVWRADSITNLGFEIGSDVYEDSLCHRTNGNRLDIKYLHSNTMFDDTLTRFGAVLNGASTDTGQFIDDWADHTQASMKRLAQADLDYQYFLTEWGHNVKRHTTEHTVTMNEYYHKCEADGVSYSQWLKRNVIDDEGLSLGERLIW